MVRTNLPVYVEPSRLVRESLGNHIAAVALLAVRAILKNQRSLEVAYQQIVFRGHHLALSSRITSSGDLVIALDVGDPQRAGRLVLENELREAERKSREEDKKLREARRQLHRTPRRW
jgi:hypothetical protein